MKCFCYALRVRALVIGGLLWNAVGCDRSERSKPHDEPVSTRSRSNVAPLPSTPEIVAPTNPQPLSIAASYPCLLAAIRDLDYHTHPATVIPTGGLHEPRNPSTGRLLQLDTSAGGGYACCEAPTFYPLVDRHDHVFWIHDYQADLRKVHQAWYGPFALCSQPPCACPEPPKVTITITNSEPPGVALGDAQSALESTLPGIEGCYSHVVRNRPTLGGTIDLRLELRPGSPGIETVIPLNGALPYDQLVQCAAGTLRGKWVVEPSKKDKAGPISYSALTVTVSFTPPSPPLKPHADAKTLSLESSALERNRTAGSVRIPVDRATQKLIAAGRRLPPTLLQLCISADGSPTSVTVKRSSGSPSFDRLVETTARTWRFKGIRVDREPMAVCSGFAILPRRD